MAARREDADVELRQERVGNVSSLLGMLFGADDSMLSASWLHSPISIAPAAGMAAVARGRAVAWKRMDSVEVDVHLPDVCNGDAFFRDDEEVNADDDDDQVTTIQWLELDCMAAAGASTAGELAQPRIFVALLIGCQSGLIRLVDRHGATVMAQRVHGAPVRGFKLRGFGTSDGTQDLLVICDEGVVVRIDGTTLIPLLQGSVGAGGVSSSASARDRGQSSHVHHAKWQLRGQGAVSDVVCGGVDSQAEGGDFFGATYYKLLVGGAHPTLSLYAACDERSNASASEMVTKLASAAFDLATSFLWGGKSSAPAADDSEPSPIEAPKIAQAVEALDDPHREIRSLCLDASGRVCAACDKLGRVLLLDIDDMTVLRLFKGYRESEVAWVAVDRASSPERGADGARAGAGESGGWAQDADGAGEADGGAGVDDADDAAGLGQEDGQCLLIYAPRRKILEAWRWLPASRVGAARMKVATRLMHLSRPLHDPLADLVDGSSEATEATGDAIEERPYVPGASFDFSEQGGLHRAPARVPRPSCGAGALPVYLPTLSAECVSVNAVGDVVRWGVVRMR